MNNNEYDVPTYINEEDGTDQSEPANILDFLFTPANQAPSSMDNLFSANHRNKMIQQYGYSEAQFITVDELNFQYGAWLPPLPKELVF